MCLVEIATLAPPAYDDLAFARWCQETARAMQEEAVLPHFHRQITAAEDGGGRPVQTMAERRQRRQQGMGPGGGNRGGEKVAVNLYVYHQV